MGKTGRGSFGAALVLILALRRLTWAANPASPEARLFLDATTQPADATANSAFDADLTGDWGGGRQQLQNAGVSVGGTFLSEGFHNFQGGIDSSHTVGSTTLDLNVTVDMQKLLNWNGGEFYVDLEDHAFRNPTTALVGDLQGFDEQNSAPYLQVFELWYQQQFFDGKLRIKVGKVDANSEFSVIDNGLSFVNGSAQNSPTNFLMPTMPDPMPSVNLFFTPNDFYCAGFGAYYANRSDRFGDLVDDAAQVQESEFGTYFTGEMGWKWTDAPMLGTGNFKVGAWGHTGTFRRFDGTEQSGTYGYYAIWDQTFWQPAGEPMGGRGVRGFIDFGVTQDDIYAIDRHIGAGITWTGPIESRPADIIGFGPEYAHISQEAGLRYPYELAVEGFYQWQVTPWAFVQPDLQYIVHPGGEHPNALVATVRVQVSF
ncbi:MAG TPA: carbohydrate porin [Tepidisphaeraceae bacterium]|nr:carbohydrate porin [Tepidisphaeraceae bacterium]